MELKKLFIYSLFILCPILFFGQTRISERIQESTIANNKESKLFFIDFWATWCGPCITVSKYLTSVQQQYPNDFYVLSLSQENPEIVKRFLNKHKIDLAIAIDYEGETFKKYEVSSLPYGVLLNASGEKLWEGHPANLQTDKIDAFLKSNTQRASVNTIFQLNSYKKENKESNIDNILDEDFKYVKLIDNYIDELQIEKKETYLQLTGTLKQILAYVNAVSEDQIELTPNTNESYKMTFKYDSNAYSKMKKTLYRKFKLKASYLESEGEVIVLNIANAKLWDDRQIDWGNDTPNFLIGDSDIKADNVSLNDIKYKLSSLLKTPIIIENNISLNKNSKHDWDIHYKYFELMTNNFLDNYGINVEKKMMSYPKYTIIKKTP